MMCNPLFIFALCNPFYAISTQWLEAWQSAGRLSPNLDHTPLFWNFRQFRSDWFASLSEAADSYMRSPLFLQWMQSYLKATTQPTHFITLL
jgi:hypothetical protein